jgi:hypothetical protein
MMPAGERMAGVKAAKKLGKFWQVVTSGLVSAKEAAIIERK